MLPSKRPSEINYSGHTIIGYDHAGFPAAIHSHDASSPVTIFKEILAESILGAERVVDRSRYYKMSDETIAPYIKDGMILESIPKDKRVSSYDLNSYLFNRIIYTDNYQKSQIRARSKTRNSLLTNGLKQYYQTSSIVHRDSHEEYCRDDVNKNVMIHVFDVDFVKTDLRAAIKAEINEIPQEFSKVFANVDSHDDLQEVLLTISTTDFPNLVLSTFGVTGTILQDTRLHPTNSAGILNTSLFYVRMPKEDFDQVTSYIANPEAISLLDQVNNHLNRTEAPASRCNCIIF